MQRITFSDNEIELLAQKGYTLGPLVNSGGTSDMFSVIYGMADSDFERVAKVLVDPDQMDSTQGKINSDNVCFVDQEVSGASRLDHPYIDDILDSFKVGKKQLLIKRRREMSLEDKLSHGKLPEEEINTFFKTH